MKNEKPKVVIVGCGFGGIELAKSLRKKLFDVLLIDKQNYHTFQPLLYQVASGGLEPGNIAYPIRRIIRKSKNVHFRMCEVQKVDVSRKKIETTSGDIEYDFLVIATGSTTNFFNFDPDKAPLLPLKSVSEALDIRSYFIQNIEKAISTYDPAKRTELINVGVIGGGPAGIELAGALAEMRSHVLPHDYPEIDFSKMKIHLFEAAPRLLSGMSEKSSAYTLSFLEKLNVEVSLDSKVVEITDHYIKLEDGTEFITDTVIWTAGVTCPKIEGLPEDGVTKGNRVLIDEYNRSQIDKSVFAIGDAAAHVTEQTPKGLPMLAPVAVQHAKHLAKNLIRIQKEKELIPFEYVNKGVMATIGRNKAVVDLPKGKLQGGLAWFIWMFVHVWSLIGFRNKLFTFVDWTVNYFNYDRPLGIIIRPYIRKEEKNSGKK